MNDTVAPAPGRGWVWVSVAVIFLATLTPQPEWSGAGQNFFALLPATSNARRDVLQNVLLYLPFGLLLGLTGISLTRAFVLTVTVSLAIELIQVWVPGRDSVALDVVTNTTGATLGWLIAATRLRRPARTRLVIVERWLATALRPDRRVAAALSLTWAALVSIIVTTTCWLFSPALPPPFFYAVAAPLIDSPPGPVRMGSDGTPSGVFSGLIDEVRIYARARTTSEIRSDMERAVSAARAPDPDLVAAYGFDSNEREAALDATGRHHAVVRSAMWKAGGRFGGALAFDGRAGEAIVSSSPAFDFRRGMTLEAWVFPSRAMSGDVPLIAHASDAYYLRASSDRAALVPSAGGRFAGAPRSVRLRRQIPANRWTHLATTYDGQVIRLYVDGQVASTLQHWSTHHPVVMSINDVDLPLGPVANPSSFQSVLLNRFTLKTTLRCGPLQSRSAPAFLMVGLQSIDVVTLVAAGSELRVESSTRARRLGLGSADYRAPRALADCSPGETRSFTLKGPLQNPKLEDRSGVPLEGLGPSVASGWTFLIDSQLMPVWVVAILSAGYLAALAFPFGFWARVSSLTLVGAGVFIASLYLAPRVWEMDSLAGRQIVAVSAGALLGILASHRHRR